MEPAWKRVWKLERVEPWLFFDSDALKPLAAACLLSARSRRGAVEWTGALSVITQLVPKSDTTLCTVRQAQCSEVSERATRGNCMPAGPAPSPSIRAPASAERAAASTQAGPRCRCRCLEPCLAACLLPALADHDVVVVDYGPRYSRVGRRVAHCCHSCHPSRRPQPRPQAPPQTLTAASSISSLGARRALRALTWLHESVGTAAEPYSAVLGVDSSLAVLLLGLCPVCVLCPLACLLPPVLSGQAQSASRTGGDPPAIRHINRRTRPESAFTCLAAAAHTQHLAFAAFLH